MGKGVDAITLVLVVIALAPVTLAIIGHSADQVFGGSFSSGNYTFNGSISIGTASPAGILDVKGASLSPVLFRDNAETIKYAFYGLGSGEDGQVSIYNKSGSQRTRIAATTSSFFLDNVGIGTTSPSFPLHVVGSSASNWAGRFDSGTAASYLSLGTGYGAYIDAGSSASSGTYALNVNKQGTSFLYVRGDGNVGIGATSPAQKLDVGGSIKVDGAIVAPEGTLRDDGGGWIRTYGNTGWYSQTHGGGWYMTDGTYLRSYGDKVILAPYYADSANANYYVDPASTSVLNSICAGGSCSSYLTHDGSYMRAQGNFRVTGTFYNDGYAYSNAFYDSGNSNYYVDPASTSIMNIIQSTSGNSVFLRSDNSIRIQTGALSVENLAGTDYTQIYVKNIRATGLTGSGSRVCVDSSGNFYRCT